MHIKTGTWEASISVCKTDPLCDSANLVSPPNPESHIRNRRLSPGSDSCGGGGGGGGVGKDTCQILPIASETYAHRRPYPITLTSDREHKGQSRGRSFWREGRRGSRTWERGQRDKERLVEDSLLSLKPPPTFPVQNSRAKLQRTVSYASKVKLGDMRNALEDSSAIGVLLENEWGLSFIGDATRNSEDSCPQVTIQKGPCSGNSLVPLFGSGLVSPTVEALDVSETCAGRPSPATPQLSIGQCQVVVESPGELLLGCHHLMEAVRYHTEEWNAILNKFKDPSKVVWYKNSLENPV